MAEATLSSPASSSWYSIRTVVVVVLFAALWVGLCRQLSGEWSVNDQYSYGWFVPVFAAILFWLRWEDSPKTESGKLKAENQGSEEASAGGRAVALIIVLGALLLLFPIRLFEIGNPDWRPLDWLHALCVVAITLVYVWSIGGKGWLKHFAFPVAFILVAVPWVTPIEEPIVQGLMRIVASIASEAAALFGIPTTVEGNLIRVPNGLLGVNEACSGVRSLQTSLMIGLLFGELKRLSILRRVFLVAAAIALAFLGNCIRAFVLVWVAATKNTEAANKWHDFAGYGIVALVFVGTLALTWTLSCGKGKIKKEAGRNEPTKRDPSDFLIPTSYFVAAFVWLFAIELAATGWYRAHERELATTTKWEVRWPRDAQNFHEIKIDEDVRRALRFDSGRGAAWNLNGTQSENGKKPLLCSVYFFRWNRGKNSALLANLHRPDVCLPAVGWKQASDSGVKNYSVAPNFELPFRHFEFLHGSAEQPTQQRAHAFYCLWEDRVNRENAGSVLPQMGTSPSAWTRSERVRVVLEGRRHLGQQVLEVVIAGRGEIDRQEVEATFAQIAPQLVKVE